MRFLVLCFIGAASAATQPALTDFIPPQSKVVIGINLRHIIDSAQFRDLQTDSQSLSTLMLAQSGLSGMNPLKDVDSIVIASTGDGEAPPTVAIIRGRFAALKLGPQKNPKGIVVRIDDSTLVAGDADIVKTVTQHHTSPLSPVLAERISSLADQYDVWGTGESAKGFTTAKDQKGFDAVDRFEFGAAFQNGVTLAAQIHVRTPEDAKKVAESLKFFEAMLKGQKIGLEVNDGTVKLSAHISEEDLKKAIATQKASFTAMPKPSQPKPDTRGKIVSNANGDTVSVTLPGGH